MIVHDLSYASRLKLTIIVWHFGDDPELVRAFLRSPISKRSFDFLLSRQLPRRQVISETRDYGYHPPQALTEQRLHPTSVPQPQSTSLPSSSLRLDAEVHTTLPPLREVMEGLFPGSENAASRNPSSMTLSHGSTFQPTSDFEKHPCTTNNKLTMNDQNILRSLGQGRDADIESKFKNQDLQM
ncbi:hypothetical protein AtubIFM55763_011637 [Aspergillus tubingensis]|nr:hypothetical protein AtubIFM55763_011637 [Aspergillus tubingensis]